MRDMGRELNNKRRHLSRVTYADTCGQPPGWVDERVSCQGDGTCTHTQESRSNRVGLISSPNKGSCANAHRHYTLREFESPSIEIVKQPMYAYLLVSSLF